MENGDGVTVANNAAKLDIQSLVHSLEALQGRVDDLRKFGDLLNKVGIEIDIDASLRDNGIIETTEKVYAAANALMYPAKTILALEARILRLEAKLAELEKK